MVTQPAPERHPYEQLLIAPEHQQRLMRIAKKQTQSSTTIAWEDAAQIAQLKVLQALRSGKFRHGGPAEFHRWATTVARCAIIDLVRQAKSHPYTSLDAPLPGTDLRVLDTIADEFDAADTLERSDLVLRAIAAITMLDQQHPDRGYLTLWRGKVQGKKHIPLAAEMGISNGEVSKRWKELVGQVAEVLGLASVTAIKQEQATLCLPKAARRRSPTQW
jgi:RNA polymerase sigma factor (sigma-70 family)